jgi:hypothetical protein
MEQKSESSEQTQNAQKKEWYKNGWGIVIAVLFFPYFLLWYMWAKTNWGKTLKITITIVFAFFNLVALMSDNPDKSTTQQAEQNPTVETKSEAPKQEIPQLPQFVFDVPSLIGKNIDEVKSALGTPNNFKEPTKQQLAITDEWYMEYIKDDNSLLITYDLKTKVVTDFFIEGTDKSKVLTTGNLKEKADDYNVQFVNSIKNANEITGVKIAKKLPAELNGNVTYNAVAFMVDNKESYAWVNCKFEINGGTFSSGYVFKSSEGIKANDSLIIPFAEFTKDGERFNFYAQKPENLFISCDTNSQHRSNYFTIN